VDGEPTNSCVRAAAEFEGMQIETVEGFGTPDKMSEVQQVFAEENVAQCGYCTAGIVCSVTALFRKTRTPSDKQIKETLNRHLCRCGSHSRILDAVDRIRAGETI
jgi:aerobic-type carbon monoxide dehydrogenase small subunit (CoxS/CutS family)